MRSRTPIAADWFCHCFLPFLNLSEAGQVAQCGDLSTFTGIHFWFFVVIAQKMRSPQAAQNDPFEFSGIVYIGNVVNGLGLNQGA